jgi:transposase
MINYIIGTPRENLTLFNECLDNIISKDNPVRFIDGYIEKLKLQELNFIMRDTILGAPRFHPKLFLKIYVYGYLERIRSSRKLEKECRRNDEMRWLTCDLAPDHWVIAHFRAENKKAFKNVFKEFLKFCHEMNLLSFETNAGDGTKIRAQNSNNEIYKRNTIEEVDKKIQKKIDEYIKMLDENDKKEEAELKFDIDKVKNALKKLKKHKGKVERIKEIFKNDPDLKVYFATDTDSRFQKDNGRVNAGYNAQTVVDDKNKLIIINDVTNKSNDIQQMTSLTTKISKVKQELKIEKESKVIYDAGYYSEQMILENKDKKGIDLYVPDPKKVKTSEKLGKNKKNKIPMKEYEADKFKINEKENIIICPEDKKLYKTHANPITEKSGKKIYEYQCKECKGCMVRKKCTKNKRGRKIKVSIHYKEIEKFKERMQEKGCKQIIRKRKEIVEHPFGTIKRNWGYRYFMQKGLDKVKGEFNLISFTYNLRRILNIYTTEHLIEALKM